MSRYCLLGFVIAALAATSDVSADDFRAPAIGEPAAIPLRPRGVAGEAVRPGEVTSSASRPAVSTIVGGLAVCLGAFFLFVWVSRRHGPAGTALLPKEVLESLGRLPFNGRQSLQLVRVGRKLVLLHVSATGVGTLTEITDPAEVDHLVGLCQQSRPSSVSASFQEVLTQYETEPTGRSFLGNGRLTEWEHGAPGNRRRHAGQEERDE